MKTGLPAIPWQAYALGALVIAGVYAVSAAPPVAPAVEGVPTNAPSDATPRPTQAPDARTQRLAAQRYWKRGLNAVIVMNGAASGVDVALHNDDLVTASQMSDKGSAIARDAEQTVQDDVPEGWDDVRDALYAAAQTYDDAFRDMHAALDSQRPSDVAAAIGKSEAAKEATAEAVHRARVHYVAMGGQANDISDGSQSAAAMRSLLQSAAER